MKRRRYLIRIAVLAAAPEGGSIRECCHPKMKTERSLRWCSVWPRRSPMYPRTSCSTPCTRPTSSSPAARSATSCPCWSSGWPGPVWSASRTVSDRPGFQRDSGTPARASGVDDCHRAVRVDHHGLTGGSQQQPGESAAPPAADHDELSPPLAVRPLVVRCGVPEQVRRGTTTQDPHLYRYLGVFLFPSG